MALPAALSLSIASLSSISSHPHSHLLPSHQINCSFSSPSPCIYSNHTSHSKPYRRLTPWSQHCCFRVSYRFSAAAEGADDNNEEAEDGSFDEAVVLFNTRDYYKCHDFLESLWNNAEEPTRTLIHGILQCAVGFHHLFNQNHKGAMMELGEGLCKLRKMNFKSGPFYQFEQEISAALDFIYQTQIELAACGYRGSLCYNGSIREIIPTSRSYDSEPPKVKLPTLNATAEHLVACQYK